MTLDFCVGLVLGAALMAGAVMAWGRKSGKIVLKDGRSAPWRDGQGVTMFGGGGGGGTGKVPILPPRRPFIGPDQS